MRSAWIAGLTLLGCVASAADLPGSTDLEGLTRFPQAQIVGFKQDSDVERIYPLDSIRRISGKLRMSDQVNATGDLLAITYQLPDHHSGIEAFSQAREQLVEQGAQLLYWCEGRACGSSSLWANQIFQRSMLYGPEAQQAFLLARVPAEADDLVALYGITRGNGRPYLQVERLQSATPLGAIRPNPATLLRQLESTGELRLPLLPAEPVADWAALLANVLRLDSTIRISLGGEGAPAWREALVAERISARRLELDDGDEAGLSIMLLR